MLLASASRYVAAMPTLGCRAASVIASKYSKATYNAALSKSPATLNKVHTELSNLSNAIKSKPDIGAFVLNPTLSTKDRLAGLSTLFSSLEGIGAKKEAVSDITKNLLAVLSENGRLGDTQDVIAGFNELVAQYKGELTVNVISATPLPKDILTRLETTLKQSESGQKTKVLKVVNKVLALIFSL
ncbi:hypothetical protein APHAL10511_000191 [Amanita phalloides]|nr:hypothetical protein APHAL10511_000191 [Amanita phalloides]